VGKTLRDNSYSLLLYRRNIHNTPINVRFSIYFVRHTFMGHIMNYYELGPDVFYGVHESGPSIFNRVHELGPDIL
jgi:hypothetical protein